MPTNLVPQGNQITNTYRGVTYTWDAAKTSCHVQGTTTGISYNSLWQVALSATPFVVDHTYQVRYNTSSGLVRFRVWFYTDTTWSSLIDSHNFGSDGSFTVPAGTGGIIIRLWVNTGGTVNETVTPEIYDITYTDVDADCNMMQQVLGWPNADFYTIWQQFAGGLPWDGESCSEIACCISYLAGNVSKIYVSNYAAGMANLYQANGRFGTTPSRGAFIWFDYDHDGVPDHTGRVYDVSNGIITTVEGNVYSYVAQFTYSINDPTIYGFGYPNYDNDPVPVPPAPAPGGNQGTYNRIRRRRSERFY